jgi:hypothetical protein
MIEVLFVNIYVMFVGRVFQQTDSQHSYWYQLCSSSRRFVPGADFIQGLPTENENKLAWSFNFAFRNTNDVLSLNNSRFW